MSNYASIQSLRLKTTILFHSRKAGMKFLVKRTIESLTLHDHKADLVTTNPYRFPGQGFQSVRIYPETQVSPYL